MSERHEETQPDKYAIVGNATEGSAGYSVGARLYLAILTGADSHKVVIRSRGGRWIKIWMPRRRISNLRVTTVPTTHPIVRHSPMLFDSRVVAKMLLSEMITPETSPP